MPYVSVHIDADEVLSDISTADLRQELNDRAKRGDAGAIHGDSHVDPDDVEDDIKSMHMAFHTGNEARAMELARKIAQDVTGRILA